MRIPGRAVIDHVAQHYGLTFAEITGDSRRYEYARPRQIAMYLMREFCPHLSYPAIGRMLGGRDHTTVLHGVQRIGSLMVTNGDLMNDVMMFVRHFRDCGASVDVMLDVRIDAATKYLNALLAEKAAIFQRELQAA